MRLRRAALRLISRFGVFSAAVIWLAQSASSAENAAIEYAVKATYLYKFAPFVDWPPSMFPSAATPISLCIVGDDPVGTVIDQAAAGQSVGPRPLAIRHVSQAAPGAGCQIMYIAGTETQTVAQALDAVKESPVLTVTDQATHPGDRGIISFVVADNHVRFDIDDAAAARAGIVISSKLLALAHSVKPRGPEAHRE
jgi:YfiR/HmsC-like